LGLTLSQWLELSEDDQIDAVAFQYYRQEQYDKLLTSINNRDNVPLESVVQIAVMGIS